MSNSNPDYDFFAPRRDSGEGPGQVTTSTANRFGTGPDSGATNQFGTPVNQFGTPTTNQFGNPITQFGGPAAAPPGTPPRSEGVKIPRAVLFAIGGVLVAVVLGFFGVGRLGFLAPDVKLPATVDGLPRNDEVSDVMAAALPGHNKLGQAVEAGDADIQIYGDMENTTLIVMAARNTNALSDAFPNATPVGDGVCFSETDREGTAIVCTSAKGRDVVAVFYAGAAKEQAHLQVVARELREDVL